MKYFTQPIISNIYKMFEKFQDNFTDISREIVNSKEI